MDASAHQNWYQWTDGIEDVSVSGSITDSEVKALRMAPNQPEISGGEVGVDSYDVLFALDAGTSDGEPVPGDVITDGDSTAFTVMNVKTDAIGATAVRYMCGCRKQVTTT